MGIQDLNEQIQSCSVCELHQFHCNVKDISKGYGKLYGRAYGETPVFFLVGENPSYNRFPKLEHAFGGHIKIGGFGNQFTELLEEVDILKYCYITNLVKCSTPTNKIGPDQIISCQPWLLKELSLINPQVVVALGSVAENALRTWIPHSLVRAYHPNYYLSYNRQRLNEYKLFWKELKARCIPSQS